MIVSVGFTPELDGKKLPLTTYRFSMSCDRQLRSSTDVKCLASNLFSAIATLSTRKISQASLSGGIEVNLPLTAPTTSKAND